MAQSTVGGPVSLRLPEAMATELKVHLFSSDGEEHGAVIGAAVVETGGGCRLLGRRLFLAADGVDYLPGSRGYRMLTADFVRRCALACADEGLAYLAVHNHAGPDRVAFSGDDMASHRRGYPALVDILDGPPAGGSSLRGGLWQVISGRQPITRRNSITQSLSDDPNRCCTRYLEGLAQPGHSTIARCGFSGIEAKRFSLPRRSPS